MARLAGLPWCSSLWCTLACLALRAFQAQATWEAKLDHGKVLGFPSYDEALSLLNQWLRRYPQLMTREQIGTSFEGRPMYAYIVGAGTDRLFEDQPQVLITSLMHAREPAGLTVLLYFLGRLMELNERDDPEAVYIIQTRKLFFVPFVNPDGWVANEGLASKVIRKNRRPTCKGRPSSSGVDLNRNFAFHWAHEFDPCNEEFQGETPFSEPETQALKKLVEDHYFRAAVNYHSFGGMLTHPFNFGKQSLPEDDQLVYNEIAEVFKWPRFGPAIQTVGYTASGESDDWLYAKHKIISMSPEVGPESGDFWPPSQLVAGIDRRNYERTMYVVKKAGLELGTSWTHSKLQDAKLPSQLKKRFQSSGGLPVSMLHLRINNKGITRSAGEALNVAVAGAARSNVDSKADNVLAVLQGDGPQASQRPARLVRDSGSALAAPIVAFQVQPLERRSSLSLRLVLGTSLEANWPMRYLTLCVAEMPRAADPLPLGAPAVCQCIGPAQTTSKAPASLESSEAAVMVRFAGRDATTDLEKLCSAAVTTATATATHAGISPGQPAAASTPSQFNGGQSEEMMAIAKLDEVAPGGETVSTDPSKVPTVGSSAGGLVLFSIAGLTIVMGLCLVVQIVYRHRSGNAESTQTSSIDGDRVPTFQQVPNDVDVGDVIYDDHCQA